MTTLGVAGDNESFTMNLTTTMATTSGVNATVNDSCFSEQSDLTGDIIALDKYITPFIYALGFPGNILAFIIWIQPRMRHSSGVYLAVLAFADFIFLLLHVLYELHEIWGKNTVDYPVVCESFTIFFLASQYLAPLLVLGFTVERYISICHPFKREKLCTTRRAQIVTASLALFSLALCGIQGYFYTVGPTGQCNYRPEIVEGGMTSLWSVWSWITEMLIFLVVPVLVLIFNVLVILEAQRLSKFEQCQLHGRAQKTSATTVMLLAVSFYLIFTTLPVTVVYVSFLNFPEGPACVSQNEDPTWIRYYKYLLARKIIEELGITHYALNFYIYLMTGKMFRKEFKRVLILLLGKSLPETLRTEYTSLRSSFGGSMKKTMGVRLTTNGNLAKEGDTTETHV